MKLAVPMWAPRPGRFGPIFAAPRKEPSSSIATTARPDEVAAMIAYLIGPDAGFIHGAQFFVDGGVDAMMRPTQF